MVQLSQSDPDTVFAQMESRVWNVDVDTFAKVVVRFQSGLVGEIEVGCISWIPRPRWHVRGEKGALLLEDWDDQFRLRTEVHGIKTDMHFDKLPSSWQEYYRNTSAVLNEGAELAVKPEEVRKAIQIIEAAFRSAETGKAVKV
jgi:predicted dehydrogenase